MGRVKQAGNMNRKNSKGALTGSVKEEGDSIEWEMRPGGMLVQKRDPDAVVPAGPVIKLKVSHGLFSHEISVPAHSTFGDVKKLLVQATGLEPREQRLLFRGKEKDNFEALHFAGVKDKSKLIVVEDPATRERKLQDQRKRDLIARACQAVSNIQIDVDKLATKISTLEGTIRSGGKTEESDLMQVSEMLMRQLLKLDSIQADGDAKTLRRTEVKRVQGLVEVVDWLRGARLKAASSKNPVVVTTQWETFDNGLGSLTAPPPSTTPIITTDWERFE